MNHSARSVGPKQLTTDNSSLTPADFGFVRKLSSPETPPESAVTSIF